MDMHDEAELISPESINVEVASTRTALTTLDGSSQPKPANAQLANRKRSSHLNHSLNENDLQQPRLKRPDLAECESDLDQITESNEDLTYRDTKASQFKKNALHKSKRSIKTLEQTLKNSKSIEKWLDKVSTEETMSYRKQQAKLAAKEALANAHSTANHLDLNIDLKTNLKLAEKIKNLIDLNTISVDLTEQQMNRTVQKFILPNSEDKPVLKWLIADRNFSLSLVKPCLNDQSQSFVLSPANLNITVLEEKDLNDSIESLDEQIYFKFDPPSGRLLLQTQKIEFVLTREKELYEQRTLNNSLSKEKLDEFRFKYVENANFVGAQCFMGMVKRKTSSLSSKQSGSSVSEPAEVSCADLSDKLFACFLSNYSCELSEYFLDSVDTIDTFGFVRKHCDRSLSFVTLENEGMTNGSNASSNNSSMSAPNLRVAHVKFGFKLDKWPAASGFTFAQRLSSVLGKKLVNTLDISTCLIVPGKFGVFK
jgi:hypothetical protein